MLSSVTTTDLEALEKQMIKNMKELFDIKYVSEKINFVDPSIPVHIKEGGTQARKIREFFTLLAICHTVLVENPNKHNPDQLNYKAQSPDEAALVTAAKDCGFAFLRRDDNTVQVDLLGVNRSYTILNIIEFNSDRKRMSVIARRPEGELVLMCKGADSVIYERLSKDENDAAIIESTSNQLASFANDGMINQCLSC